MCSVPLKFITWLILFLCTLIFSRLSFSVHSYIAVHRDMLAVNHRSPFYYHASIVLFNRLRYLAFFVPQHSTLAGIASTLFVNPQPIKGSIVECSQQPDKPSRALSTVNTLVVFVELVF